MNNKNVIVRLANNDIYFIIDNKEISILKIMNDLEKKVDKLVFGGLTLTIIASILTIPSALAFIGITEIKEQNAAIEKQNAAIEKQNDRLEKQNDRLENQNKKIEEENKYFRSEIKDLNKLVYDLKK